MDTLGHDERTERDGHVGRQALGDLRVAVAGDAHRLEEAADRVVGNMDGIAGERRVVPDDAGFGGEPVEVSAHHQPSSPEKRRSDRPSRSTVSPPAEGAVRRVDQPAPGVDPEPPAPRLVLGQRERQRVVPGADHDEQALGRIAEEQADHLGVAVAP